ncbi:MAG: tyrosine-protein phosphatase [Ruminococcus sp.]|nr:tyrosine-protein phosphatase [Ruminococcus sp.]
MISLLVSLAALIVGYFVYGMVTEKIFAFDSRFIYYLIFRGYEMNLNQSIPLTSLRNAREIGGYCTADGRKVKRGVLLRTANLRDISDDDKRKLSESYNLQYLIDFRLPMEIADAIDPEIHGAEYHHLDVIDMSAFVSDDIPDIDFTTLDLVGMTNLTLQCGMYEDDMYIGFLMPDYGKKAFSSFFRLLLSADSDRAVLWHCTGGKDRTGVAAMLLLSALGVDEEVIIEDYMLTNKYNAEQIEKTRQYLKSKGCDDEFISKGILVFDAVDEVIMRTAIDYLKAEYGSVVGYIRDELNISNEEINSLKEKYLL